ncbi:hypothetical protein M3Y97_00576500 [Aphelenchoides bicaudatus]|nr:hypothetical protein M3Y97_00576500 [Aphelenchoides bicaudatus]
MIIGVKKGGTRALIDALQLHPQIVAAKREVHFFDDETLYEKGLDWYREQMPLASNDQIVIEKTPAYFTKHICAKRVYSFNPTIKLIIIFNRLSTKNMSLLNFEENAFKLDGVTPNLSFKPISNSIYVQHFGAWLEYFPSAQFLIVDGDKFITDPMQELKKIETFLGLEHKIDSSQLVFNKRKRFTCSELLQMDPDIETIGLPETGTGTSTESRRRVATRSKNASFSWTNTEVRYSQHSHDWIIQGFSQTDCRYLETTFSITDKSTSSTYTEPLVNTTYKIRLHPQGNKSSNLEFSFFQIFSLAQNAKFKAKFFVFNSNNDEIPTTVYSGAQQLNGFFQYVRRNDLLKHIENDDELRLTVSVTTFSDTIMRHGNYLKHERSDISQPDETLSKDFEVAFNDERFSDFKIYCGERKQCLHVHRVILAARSPYFSAMLSPHTKEYKEGKVEFPDLDYEVFSEILTFLYTGRAPRIRSMALEIMILCDRFQISQLKDLAIRVLKEVISSSNVCNILINADLHSALKLKEAAIEFIVQNSSTILKSNQWDLLLTHAKLVTEVCLAMSNDAGKQAPLSEPLSKRLKTI